MANIYKLNSGQLTSKQAILDAFAIGEAVLVYYRNARMHRPTVGLMLNGQSISDTRPFDHYSGNITHDIGQWSKTPSSAQQCLDVALGKSK
jgi:hypothetical protein